MDYLATFYTHSGAVKYKRYLERLGVQAENIPVPRKLSSNCGIAVKFTTSIDIRTLISDEIEKVFLIQDGKDAIIYNNDAVQ
jgi:hypothetical protein